MNESSPIILAKPSKVRSLFWQKDCNEPCICIFAHFDKTFFVVVRLIKKKYLKGKGIYASYIFVYW